MGVCESERDCETVKETVKERRNFKRTTELSRTLLSEKKHFCMEMVAGALDSNTLPLATVLF